MIEGLLGDPEPAEHARHFIHPFCALQYLNPAAGAAIPGLFADLQVMVAEGGDLGQVGDADDLPLAGQFAQLAADDFRHPSADAHIDLVEYQGGNGRAAGADHLDRQADARQFAARGDLAQGPERLAGVGADHELGLFQSLTGEIVLPARAQLDLETPAFHAQLLHALADLRGQFFGGFLAALAEFFGP